MGYQNQFQGVQDSYLAGIPGMRLWLRRHLESEF